MTESIFTTKGAAFASHTHKKIQFVPIHSIGEFYHLSPITYHLFLSPSFGFFSDIVYFFSLVGLQYQHKDKNDGWTFSLGWNQA